jgi:hypothetical protein
VKGDRVVNIGIIIGMASVTIGSMLLEGVLNKAGKMEEAKYVGMTTNAGIGITAITTFITLIKALKSLG